LEKLICPATVFLAKWNVTQMLDIIPAMSFFPQIISIPYDIEADTKQLDHDIRVLGIIIYADVRFIWCFLRNRGIDKHQLSRTWGLHEAIGVIRTSYSVSWIQKVGARMEEQYKSTLEVYRKLGLPVWINEMEDVALNTVLRSQTAKVIHPNSSNADIVSTYYAVRGKPMVRMHQIISLFAYF